MKRIQTIDLYAATGPGRSTQARRPWDGGLKNGLIFRANIHRFVPLWMALAFFVVSQVGDATPGHRPAHKLLFVTQSAGFEHDVIKRDPAAPDKLSHAEQILTDLCAAANIEVTCTKDCSKLTADYLQQFDAVFFYTTGDLPIPNRQDLLDYVAGGKGFIGSHCATDTFHGWKEQDKLPYIEMIGAEFQTHHAQEVAEVEVVNAEFPSCTHFKSKSFEINDEWYMFKNFSPDIQVDLKLNTKSMKQSEYNSVEPYPISWHRSYGQGRVFYTAMGHRADVWTNPLFQQHLLGGIQWAIGAKGDKSN